MLETVFAIGILLIVVAAIMALTSANLSGQRESELQIIANNLAREGIEVVRNARDSNWLAGIDWDDNLVGDNTAIPVFEYSKAEEKWENRWSINFDVDSLDEDKAGVLIFADVYNQQVVGSELQPSGNKPSGYSRILIFKYICEKPDGSEETKDNCGTDEKKIGIKVESRVGWVEKGGMRLVKISDLLYDWK